MLANRKYAILLGELADVGANPGKTALDMLDLGNPDLDWVQLANGMGVEAARADDMERFADLFAVANRRPRPVPDRTGDLRSARLESARAPIDKQVATVILAVSAFRW